MEARGLLMAGLRGDLASYVYRAGRLLVYGASKFHIYVAPHPLAAPAPARGVTRQELWMRPSACRSCAGQGIGCMRRCRCLRRARLRQACRTGFTPVRRPSRFVAELQLGCLKMGHSATKPRTRGHSAISSFERRAGLSGRLAAPSGWWWWPATHGRARGWACGRGTRCVSYRQGRNWRSPEGAGTEQQSLGEAQHAERAAMRRTPVTGPPLLSTFPRPELRGVGRTLAYVSSASPSAIRLR